MGPGVEKLKKMHEQWSENKEVYTPKTNKNIGKNILKDIISGSDKNTHVINSRNGGGTILKGVWVSYRENGKKTNIHKVTMYHDVLTKAGLSRDDIVSPVITGDGNYLAK